ncbi:hypothetical protein KC717_03980, partial [Candidatus Dojkabacteria bacterium]|nr:hypothetical protein [Candidatus Dojkabacteria bacterium]
EDLHTKHPDARMQIYSYEDLVDGNLVIGGRDMFSKETIHIVKHSFSLSKSKREELYSAMHAHASEQFILWEGKKVDKRSKEYKEIKKKGIEREYSNLANAQLKRWIGQILKVHKLESMGNILRDELMTRYGTNQWIIESEVKKLSSYLKEVGPQEFEKNYKLLLSPMQEVNSWEFIDLFFGNQKNKAYEFLERGLQNPGDEYILIGSLASQMRCIAILLEYPGVNVDELARKAGIHPFRLKKSRSFLAHFTKKKLRLLSQSLANLDYACKRSEIEPRHGLGLLIAMI